MPPAPCLSRCRIFYLRHTAPIVAPILDFDGDGKTDIAIRIPENGLWIISRSSDGIYTYAEFGAPDDIPVPGDYDGDGKTDIAVWRPAIGFWYIINSSDGTTTYMPSTEPPVIFRSLGTMTVMERQILPSGDRAMAPGISFAPPMEVITFGQWGSPDDIPVPGDYDGDGKIDIAVWTPASGLWTIIRSSDGATTYTMYGGPGDIPVPGDYDGDGKTDIAIWRPSKWHLVYHSLLRRKQCLYPIRGPQ